MLYEIMPVPETVLLYNNDPANSPWTTIMHNSSSGQLDKLYDPHLRRNLGKTHALIKKTIFFLYFMASYFCSSNYDRLILVMSLHSSENLLNTIHSQPHVPVNDVNKVFLQAICELHQ
jgi:hypothetical protein